MMAQRPVRVLHLIAELGGGGSERWLWDVVRLSPPEQFEHTVATIYPDYSGNFVYADHLRSTGAYKETTEQPEPGLLHGMIKGLRAQRPRLMAIPLMPFALRLGANGLATWRVLKVLMRFRPDVVHAHTLPDFILGMMIRLIFNKPLIHTVPCIFSQMKDTGYGWMPKLYARLHPWVDYFSTGEGRSELISIGIPPAKILYDLGGVDLSAVDAVQAERERHRREVRESLGLSEDALVALSVGRLHPSKGHAYALETLPTLVQSFPNLHWVALGEGEERAALESRAKELRVSDHVHLIGFQNNPFPYFAAADLYLRTTVLEPENLSFYQSMAMGLPTVGFDTQQSGADLITKVGHGHLVANRDAEALGAATAAILTLPDGGRSLGQRGAIYCREHLDLQQSIRILSSAYAELARKGEKRRAKGETKGERRRAKGES
ncbi:MAG: glycosyltransferase [Pyrinomonadaceae bacterium]